MHNKQPSQTTTKLQAGTSTHDVGIFTQIQGCRENKHNASSSRQARKTIHVPKPLGNGSGAGIAKEISLQLKCLEGGVVPGYLPMPSENVTKR
jgi:hypothetical protein